MPSRTGVIALALAAFSASAAASQPLPPPLSFDLHLHCTGSWTAPVSKPRVGIGAQPHPAPAAVAPSPAEEVLVDFEGDQGRIRIPRDWVGHLLGGDTGWRSISDLVVEERQITGRFWVNPIDRPALVIDRMTGRIDVAGFRDSGFHGDCSAYDPNETPKF